MKYLFTAVQSLSCFWLLATRWTAACLASLSFTISLSLLKVMSIELVMPSNHLILCRPLLLPSIFPSIRVFYSEAVVRIRCPKYWTFSTSTSNEYSGWFLLGLTGLISLQSNNQINFSKWNSVSIICLVVLYRINYPWNSMKIKDPHILFQEILI